MAKKDLGEEQQHIHYWGPSYDLVESKCKCGAIKISYEECERRKNEWNNYFELVRTTSAYLDYQEMKKVWPDKELMKPILERVQKRGHWGVNDYGDKVWVVEEVDLTGKPHFPDPSTWNKYVIQGEA